MTNPWKPDPRLDRDPRAMAPRRPRPVERDTCSCGCRSLHEVARRRLVDDGILVVLSDGTHRLFTPGCIGANFEVYADRFSDAALALLSWASVYTSDKVRTMLAELPPRGGP